MKSNRVVIGSLVLFASFLPASLARADGLLFLPEGKDGAVRLEAERLFVQFDAAAGSETLVVSPVLRGKCETLALMLAAPGRPTVEAAEPNLFRDLRVFTRQTPSAEGMWLFDIAPKPDPFGRDREGPTLLRSQPPLQPAPVTLPTDFSKRVRVFEAKDRAAIDAWLREGGLVVGQNAKALERLAVEGGFVAGLVLNAADLAGMSDTAFGVLDPIVLTFPTARPVVPVAISCASAADSMSLSVFVVGASEADLEGDFSWRPSYRSCWLTYMQQGIDNAELTKELDAHTAWIKERVAADGTFSTTKLAWARKLGPYEFSVLDEPERFYADAEVTDLPPHFKRITLENFCQALWRKYEATREDDSRDKAAKERLESFKKDFADVGDRFAQNTLKEPRIEWWEAALPYFYFPRRNATPEELQGLPRLRPRFKKGQWLTSFEREVKGKAWDSDLHIVDVPEGTECEHVRKLGTSEP